MPEYAREYIEKLNRPYNYLDIVNIAKKQIEQLEKQYSSNHQAIFFDTGPEITQVWFEEVYGKCPKFLTEYIKSLSKTIFMVCDTDLAWQKDKVRENGTIKRHYLLKRYEQILRLHKFTYVKISGIHQKRLKSAENILTSAYHLQKAY